MRIVRNNLVCNSIFNNIWYFFRCQDAPACFLLWLLQYWLSIELLCIFCIRSGPTIEDNSSTVVVFSVVPFQLNNGIFNKLVSSSSPIEKPQFLDWMCKPISISDNNWTYRGALIQWILSMMVSDIQHMGH